MEYLRHFNALLPPANEVWGNVIFLHQFVILFTGGACVVAPGGVHGCSGGRAWFYLGGHAWFYSGGMCGFIRGACMVFSVFSDTMRYGQ